MFRELDADDVRPVVELERNGLNGTLRPSGTGVVRVHRRKLSKMTI